LVGERRIVNPRDDRRRHVFQALEAVECRIRLKGNQLDGGIELAQTPSGADKRAARAETRDKVRQFAAGLLDQLWRGRVVMSFPVGVVVVLIRIEIPVGIGGVEAACLTNRAVSALEGAGQPQLGAKRAKDELSL